MIDATLFAAALTAGLLGSGHCLGMCGGISGALGLAGQFDRHRHIFIKIVLYNLGRLSSYSLAGAVAGSVLWGMSAGVDYANAGWVLRILTGVLIAAVGVHIAFGWGGLRRIDQIGVPLWRMIAPLARRLLPADSAIKVILLGAAWGFLPCGLVYSMLLLAATTAEPIPAAAVMFGFGLGTLPAMVCGGLLGGHTAVWLRRRGVQQFAGCLLVVAGVASAVVPLPHMLHQHGPAHGTETSYCTAIG